MGIVVLRLEHLSANKIQSGNNDWTGQMDIKSKATLE